MIGETKKSLAIKAVLEKKESPGGQSINTTSYSSKAESNPCLKENRKPRGMGFPASQRSNTSLSSWATVGGRNDHVKGLSRATQVRLKLLVDIRYN